MSHCRKPLCAAILSAIAAATGSVAWADQPAQQQDVSAEISTLRARID